MSLHSFKLSKILVAVISLVALLNAGVAVAQDNYRAPDYQAQVSACMKEWEARAEMNNLDKTEPARLKQEDRCLRLIPGNSAVTTDPCKERQKEYHKARNDYDASCSLGSEECLDQVLTCSTCTGKTLPAYCPRSEVSTADRRKELNERLAGKTKTKSKSANELKKIRMCPTVAFNRVEELKEQVEKHEDKEEQYEDDLNEAKEELATIEGELKEEYAEHQTAIEEINAIREENEKKIKTETTDELKAKRQAYDKLNNDITQMTLEIQKINLQKIEAMGAAERECHTKALGNLEVFLKDRRAAMNASQLSAGSLKNLFTSSGKTRTEKNADFAMKYYTACMKDRMHTDKIASIKRAHALQLEQINSSIGSMRSQQLSLIQEISGEETQKKFKEQIESIYKQHQRETQKETSRYYAAHQKKVTAIESLRAKIQTLQQRLETEQALLRDKIIVYGAADEATGGGGKDDPGAKFMSNYSTLKNAAETFLGCCSPNPEDSSMTADCKRAKDFYCANLSPSARSEDQQCNGTTRGGKYKSHFNDSTQ